MSGESPIDRGYLLTELGAVLETESWMLVNGVATQPRRLWDCVEPNCFLGWTGGGGLGYRLGAALGASLGLRDTGKIAVSIQSDGDFLYTPCALWTAAHHEIPVLTAMYNNWSYYNSEAHARTIATERDRPLETAPIATQLRAPDFDFGAEARLYGLWGEGPIEDPAEIRPALERALKVVKEEGRYALVDIICSNPPPPR